MSAFSAGHTSRVQIEGHFLSISAQQSHIELADAVERDGQNHMQMRHFCKEEPLRSPFDLAHRWDSCLGI